MRITFTQFADFAAEVRHVAGASDGNRLTLRVRALYVRHVLEPSTPAPVHLLGDQAGLVALVPSDHGLLPCLVELRQDCGPTLPAPSVSQSMTVARRLLRRLDVLGIQCGLQVRQGWVEEQEP